MDQAIAFKEWQIVCDALASGRQSILLRKGGIHEGRAGFSFAHSSFFLFPTRFHNQSGQVREGAISPMPEWQAGETVSITHHVEVPCAVTLTDWQQVAELERLHIYSERTLRDRFDWQGKGITAGSIHVAVVRVRALTMPFEFSYEASHGGCRSWVLIPKPPESCMRGARLVQPLHAMPDWLRATEA